MLASIRARCTECLGEVMDVGDEFVCRSCGVVTGKEVLETGAGGAPKAIDYTGQALGGYLGPIDYGFRERFTRGLAASSSSFRYLKLVSDYAGREDSTAYSCVKMIERVCEKLSLPRIVMAQAATVAKKLLCMKKQLVGINGAAISAYSIVTACKIEDVTSVGVREVVDAHRLLGRRVKVSSMIELSLNSPFKTRPRRPEDYVSRIVGRLSCSVGPVERLREDGTSATAYFNSLREAAMQALGTLDEEGRGGHSPCSLAATGVYAGEVMLARRESRKRRVTQRDVADCCDIAEYTVREQYGRLFRPAMAPEASRQPQPLRRRS